MVSSILRISSQVEHTKKRNSIDSESKYVKRNSDHQNHSTVCFYMLLYYYHTVRKHFWLEQSALMPSDGRSNMYDCFDRLEDSSSYSASVLQTKVAKNMSSIAEGISKVKCYTYHGNHVFYFMATIIFLLFLFSRLEVIPSCCNNLTYIFIHTYYHCQASKAKQMVWQVAERVVNVPFH